MSFSMVSTRLTGISCASGIILGSSLWKTRQPLTLISCNTTGSGLAYIFAQFCPLPSHGLALFFLHKGVDGMPDHLVGRSVPRGETLYLLGEIRGQLHLHLFTLAEK